MSDDAPDLTPEGTSEEPKKAARKATKKVAKKAARKVAKDQAAETVEAVKPADAPAPVERAEQVAPSPAAADATIERPTIPSNVRIVSPSQTAHHSAPETIGGGEGDSKSKRRRRRKKKGGAGHGQGNGAPAGETHFAATVAATEPKETSVALVPSAAPAAAEPQPQRPRVAHDRETVARRAWKIFQSEVSEEGLALINDNDARDIARRSFRLAEIFLDEQARRS